MKILGISCFYHDSAACLVVDGEIVAAAQEERFTRVRHDDNFPQNAIDFCLERGGTTSRDLDLVVFYDKPFLKLERLLESYLAFAPSGFRSFITAIPIWLKKKLWTEQLIRKNLDYKEKILFTQHHQAHAASAFYPSPYQEAAFLTVDGVGEWATASFGVGSGNKLEIKAELKFPSSLGLLYSAFTYYLGFKVNSGEYKVMGLAPYGMPKYKNLIYEKLIDLRNDGSFALHSEYFNYTVGLTMTSDKFNQLFGGLPRKPESKLTQKEMDIARSIQEVTEEIMLKMVNHIHKVTGHKFLCLSGGVALNCVANGKILREGPFDDIWIQPAAGDAGSAAGAALYAWYTYTDHHRIVDGVTDSMKGTFLGPEYSDIDIGVMLEKYGARYEKIQDSNELTMKTAELLAHGNVVGWFQGRMEFGPRALGNRSILGDARDPKMQSRMNLKIKFRESFRPFAPSVLAECVSEYFEIGRQSPYMLLTADISKNHRRQITGYEQKLWGIDKLNVIRSDIPAVTHIDYSARLQTVDPITNPLYHQLISDFYKLTQCPVIVNTSFNVRGEPIVCTPEDGFKCFMRTDIDYLVIGHFVLSKKDQPAFSDNEDWQKKYALD